MHMKLTTILTFLIVAVVGSIGPASARVPQSEIHYSAAVVGGSVALTTDGGSLKTDGRRLFILDNSDGLVASIPLSYDRDSRTWPITAAIDSNTATLTPRAHPDSAATPAETPHDIAIDPQSDAFDNALVRFSTQINLAVTLGTLIGTVVGAGIGCLAGGSVGAAIGAVGNDRCAFYTGLSWWLPGDGGCRRRHWSHGWHDCRRRPGRSDRWPAFPRCTQPPEH